MTGLFSFLTREDRCLLQIGKQLREGIDDIRYVYQLEKLFSLKSEEYPEEVAMAEQLLDEIREMCDFDDREIREDFGAWTPERFDSLRNQVIAWIIKLNPEIRTDRIQ